MEQINMVSDFFNNLKQNLCIYNWSAIGIINPNQLFIKKKYEKNSSTLITYGDVAHHLFVQQFTKGSRVCIE